MHFIESGKKVMHLGEKASNSLRSLNFEFSTGPEKIEAGVHIGDMENVAFVKLIHLRHTEEALRPYVIFGSNNGVRLLRKLTPKGPISIRQIDVLFSTLV